MSEVPLLGERLDSWKAIAKYLHRDLATVRRWEKRFGLPVRRVAATGRSVFAYTSEIDGWLQTGRPILPLARPIAAEDLRVELTSAGVIARDSGGAEQWRHPFPATYRTFVPVAPAEPIRLIGGTSPGVYFITGYRGRQQEDQVESGVLTLLDIKGRPRRSFSLGDQVTFQSTTYGPPWALTAFDVEEKDGTCHVVVTAHHYTWDPALVTILDAQWQRRGTFVHAGWIDQVRWLGSERLLIGGFSNAHDGGMVALLDPAALDGQGPEPAGSRHFCETCGTDRPLRMFVLPRTEINRVTASRFNRVVIQTWDDRVVAQTIEMPSSGGDPVALYEFTPSLDFVSARFSDRYWEIHQALETEGLITHTREQCPDRDGPRQIQMWEPATGWRDVQINRLRDGRLGGNYTSVTAADGKTYQ